MFNQSSDPGATSSGKGKLYFKTDGNWYSVDSSGTIKLLTAISSDAVRNPVRVASTANVASISGLLTIDSITVAAGDRVLLKNQSTGSQNGIYVAASGAWTRATDFATTSTIKGSVIVAVEEGTTNQDQLWMLTTNGPITIGTTSLSFSQIGGLPSGTASGDLGATYPSPTVLKASTSFALTGTTTTSVTADQNDWAIFSTNLAVVHATPTALRTITGLTSGTDGRIVILHNDSGANSLVLSHEGAGSTAANRFNFLGSNDITLQGGVTIVLMYSGADSRWIALTANSLATTSVNGQMSSTDKTKLNNTLLGFENFRAADFDDPNNADWPITVAAQLTSDSVNIAIGVRRFDDTANEAISCELYCPTGATTLSVIFNHRAQTAPGTAKAVGYTIRTRESVAGSAVSSWTTPSVSTIAIPTNASFRYDTVTVTGLTAGRTNQILIVREGSNGSDTLVADWVVKFVRFEWS